MNGFIIDDKGEEDMAVTLAMENMLKAFGNEDKDNDQNIKKDCDLETVLKRFENATGQNHNRIRYSDGKERNTSFDD